MMVRMNVRRLLLLLFLLALGAAAKTTLNFAPFQQWAQAVRSGNAKTIAALYSAQPLPALIVSTGVITDVPREASFWATWKKEGLTKLAFTSIVDRAAGSNLHQIGFEAGIYFHTRSGPHTFFLFVQQTWQHQPAGWRIISGGRSDLSQLKQPTSLATPIYSKSANARADIAAALTRARANGKRVLLVFGGNWCYDCHVLDIAFQRSDLAPLLKANYDVVPVDVEEFNYNLDVLKHYGLSIQQGVPMVAVLSAQGKVLASTENGSMQAARSMSPQDLIRFLTTWEPATKG
ncbi:MAG: thioredoxin family protein [Rhizomicrobium sp.]